MEIHDMLGLESSVVIDDETPWTDFELLKESHWAVRAPDYRPPHEAPVVADCISILDLIFFKGPDALLYLIENETPSSFSNSADIKR
jgi:hypothetical protein